MVIFRSLKTLITRNPKSKNKSLTRPVFTAGNTTATTITTTTLFLIPHLYTHLSHRAPFSKWIAPFQGPLFLSFPPWKLSQSATPLNGVVLRKVQSLHLDLIRGGNNLPSKLGFVSGFPSPNVVNRDGSKEEAGSVGLVKSFLNSPNLVSMSRLVSGPVIAWMITNEMYSSAFVALAISGTTDWLDGYMARRMKIDSVVGSYLDPHADKVLIGCVALSMVHMDLLHPGLVGLVLFRDVGLVVGAFYQRASSLGWKKVEPLFLSKVNTALQLVLIAAALLQPEFGTPETQSYITWLSLLVASTTVATTAAYGAQYMSKRSALVTGKS